MSCQVDAVSMFTRRGRGSGRGVRTLSLLGRVRKDGALDSASLDQNAQAHSGEAVVYLDRTLPARSQHRHAWEHDTTPSSCWRPVEQRQGCASLKRRQGAGKMEELDE
eukprot:549107-Rhodomonas_salina.2